MGANIQPQWVYEDNDPNKTLKHVSSFRNSKNRPDVRCPQCNGAVTLALGEKNVDHFRHKGESDCVFIHKPESVMHFNCKMHIHSQLVKGHKLSAWMDCYCPECLKGGIQEVLIFEGWDKAQVECRAGQFIVDIGVLKGAELKGAIEIFVTHKLGSEKVDFLSQRLNFIELKISKQNYDEIINWKINTPLKDEFISQSSLKVGICPVCIKSNKEEKLRQNKIKFLEKFPQVIQCLGVRDIDLMYNSGNTYRMYLELYADYRKGTILRTWMKFRGWDKKMYEVTIPNNLHHVKKIYRKILKNSFQLVDIPTLKYSKKCRDIFVHEARDANSPEPAKKKIEPKASDFRTY